MRRLAPAVIGGSLASVAMTTLLVFASAPLAAACTEVSAAGLCAEVDVPGATPDAPIAVPVPVPEVPEALPPSPEPFGGQPVGAASTATLRGLTGIGIGVEVPDPCAEFGAFELCPGQLFEPLGEPAPAALAAPVPADAPPPPPPVDGAAVALQLIDRAPFEVAEIRTAPEAPFKSYVNLENWMWVPEGQWRDVVASVDAGTATVTITAAPTRVEWQMGDGGVRSCFDAGREWQTYYGDAEQTSCSYTYERPSITAATPEGAFKVQARFFYDVAWACAGACAEPGGALGEYPAPPATADLVVGERQSVVVSGSYR